MIKAENFKLAYIQTEKEGNLNKPNSWELILDRAITIRHYLDMVEQNNKVAEKKDIKSDF